VDNLAEHTHDPLIFLIENDLQALPIAGQDFDLLLARESVGASGDHPPFEGSFPVRNDTHPGSLPDDDLHLYRSLTQRDQGRL
jgi:hypothetical protein